MIHILLKAPLVISFQGLLCLLYCDYERQQRLDVRWGGGGGGGGGGG